MFERWGMKKNLPLLAVVIAVLALVPAAGAAGGLDDDGGPPPAVELGPQYDDGTGGGNCGDPDEFGIYNRPLPDGQDRSADDPSRLLPPQPGMGDGAWDQFHLALLLQSLLGMNRY